MQFLPIVKSILPHSWCISEENDLYLYCHPESKFPPPQGWKVYVSCHFFTNPELMISKTVRCCVEMMIPFKVVKSKGHLVEILSKNFPREESAKFLVMYPPDPETCFTILKRLADKLDGRDAPPVLSARQFKNSPIYYRYGANSKAGMRHPLTGNKVPDLIYPWYSVPPWIAHDPFQPELDRAINADTDADAVVLKGRYQVSNAICFSASGGVYLANDSSDNNRSVILKEARKWMSPHPVTGEDAVARLIRESKTLQKIQGLKVVPQFIELFMEGDHAFLVREYIRGQTLFERKANEPFRASEIATLRLALEDILELRDILGAQRLDLSPQNVIFEREKEIRLLDFETDLGDDDEYTWGTPGFIPPREDGICPWEWSIQSLIDFCRY